MSNTFFPVPSNENERLNALYQYDLLDTLSEKEYDFITTMATQICNTQASLITLLDEKRQYVKSCFGFEIKETPRELSFCNYTILNPNEVNIVSDLRLDKRYNSNPLVTGDPHAVFYAGAPLVTPEGFVLGSICVLDPKAKTLTTEQEEALKALAQQVITTMELKKKNSDLKLTQKKLKKTNESLEEFVKLVSHDMKTPLANITMLSKGFRSSYKKLLDKGADGYIELIQTSATELIEFIDRMLERTHKKGIIDTAGKAINSKEVLKKVIRLVAPPNDVEIKVKGRFPKINIDEIALQQVFQNLITNAIKYNDKSKRVIIVKADCDEQYYYFHFSDNGCGIAPCDLEKIFLNEQTLGKTDRYGNKGTGIGLAQVKYIVESAGGHIFVESILNNGTDFKIQLPQNVKD